MTEHDRLVAVRIAAKDLAGAVLSVRKRNTDEWMDYIAHTVNNLCIAIGEDDRFQYDGRDQIKKVK